MMGWKKVFKFMIIEKAKRSNKRQSRTLHSPPPGTKLEFQLKYRAIKLNNELKTS